MVQTCCVTEHSGFQFLLSFGLRETGWGNLIAERHGRIESEFKKFGHVYDYYRESGAVEMSVHTE